MSDTQKKTNTFKRFFGFGKEASAPEAKQLMDKTPLTGNDTLTWDGGTTISSLLGGGKKQARSRSEIYAKFSEMEADPFVAAALRLHVTAALGGDPSTGQSIYIETLPDFEGDKQAEKLVDELRDVIEPLVNDIDQAVAYNAMAFGDGYSRVYSDKKRGVYHLLADELVRPPLIQPFEQAGRTVGYVSYAGEKPVDRLKVSQIARMKMQRGQAWVPQHQIVEKSYRMALTEDDIDKVPVLPSMVGGSILYTAEEPFDDLRQSLVGLVGQRWVDSMDEQIMTVNMDHMSDDQQKRYLESIKAMMEKSKGMAERAMKEGKPIMERVRHLIPVFGEKQMAALAGGTSQGRQSVVTTEDVMFHAKSMCGSLGVDLSMVGFSDLLSGGFGDGGHFRNSAQMAESSTNTRSSMRDFVNSIIDIHTYSKFGMVFAPNKRPWKVSFFGSNSALENERQNTRLQAMNSLSMLLGSMQQAKDLGMTKGMMKGMLRDEALLDEDAADLYAPIVDIKTEEEGGGFGEDDPVFNDENNDGLAEPAGTGEGQGIGVDE